MKNSKKSILSLLMLLIFSFNMAMAQELPDLKGTQAIVFDYDTGEVIYTKDIDSKAYPASMTKLMTALLLAENKSKTDSLTYTKNAAAQPAFSYGKNVEMVLVGDTMSADNAMDALLLYSGNDIAYMIADNISGNPENFIKEMNKKASELGMTNTNFVTPNGLDDNSELHKTTPYDMALLMKAAYSNDWIAESMAKEESLIRTKNSIPRMVQNRNKNLNDNGCIGGKTGYTNKAGRCLTAVYKRGDRTLIGVVMNSEYNQPQDTVVFEDMAKLMDYGFSKDKIVLNNADDTMKTLTVQYKAIPFIGPTRTIEVPLLTKEDINYYKTDITPTIKIEPKSFDIWKINNETVVGTAKITIKDYEINVNLYTTVNKSVLMKENFLIYIGAALALLILIILIILIIKKISGGKRNKYSFK